MLKYDQYMIKSDQHMIKSEQCRSKFYKCRSRVDIVAVYIGLAHVQNQTFDTNQWYSTKLEFSSDQTNQSGCVYLGHLYFCVTRCTWDENVCGLDDFALTVTDYGYCYTFNSGQNNKPALEVSTTGRYRLEYSHLEGGWGVEETLVK